LQPHQYSSETLFQMLVSIIGELYTIIILTDLDMTIYSLTY